MLSIKAFPENTRGNVAIIFSLALLPLMTAVGVAIDYSRATSAREELQQRLDAAVLAGVREETEASQRTSAGRMFDSHALRDSTQLVSRDFARVDGELVGTATATVDTAMLGIVRIDHLTIRADSRAAAAGAPVCILVNNPSASQSLTVNSGVQILAPGCEMHVRSSAAQAAVINNGENINMQRVCIKSTSITENGGKSAAVEKGCDAIQNPFAGNLPKVSVPNLPANNCSASYKGPTSGSTITVPPGNYCGLNFNGPHTSLTLSAGNYKSVNFGNTATVTFEHGSYEGINQNSGVKTFNIAGGYLKDLTISAETVNLGPGTYQNLTFNSGVKTVNLAPGLYIWKGKTTLNAGKFVGTGVTIYFPDRDSYMQINSGPALQLSAPSSGTYQGILFFEPDGLQSSQFNVNGSAQQVLDGLIYWPSRDVTFNSTSKIMSDRISLVVDKLRLNQIDWQFENADKGMWAGSGGVVRLTR